MTTLRVVFIKQYYLTYLFVMRIVKLGFIINGYEIGVSLIRISLE